MLISNISNTLKLVFTGNRNNDFNAVMYKLKLAGPTGDVKKGVNVNHSSSYNSQGTSKSEVATKVDNGGKTIYILNDKISFYYHGIDDFLSRLRYFGDKVLLKIKGNTFTGSFSSYKNNSIEDSDGKIITFKSSVSTEDDNTQIHKFIHRMKTDNGRMIDPLIKRYSNTLRMVKGKRQLLTGYANLYDYLTYAQNPSSDILNSFSESFDSEGVTFNINNKGVELKASGESDGKMVVNLLMKGDFEKPEGEKQTPYVILNTKPIKLLNQQMPYFVSRQKYFPVFITTLFFKNDETLKNLKGGINLLK